MIIINYSNSIYYPSKEGSWTTIYWLHVEKTIENLQHRITKAANRKDKRRLRTLQHLLTRSYSARLKAIQIVTQKNSDKKIPGIDQKRWITPDHKIKAAFELRKKLPIKPLRRFSIFKANRKKWHVDILCMSDRARQVLWAMALTPLEQNFPDSHFYELKHQNFYRQSWNIKAQLYATLTKFNFSDWTLNIEKRFEFINNYWFLSNIPMAKKIFKKWLTMGYFDEDKIYSKMGNYFQNEIILSILIKLTLCNFEKYIRKKFSLKKFHKYDPLKTKEKIQTVNTLINIIYFNNSVIFLSKSKKQLQHIKKVSNNFFKSRGFKISEKKTLIRRLSNGVDCLGWTLKKNVKNKLLCKISKDNISKHKKNIKYTIKKNSRPEKLIPLLNYKIHNWMNYHQSTDKLWKIRGQMKNYIYQRLMKWCQKRHGRKTKKWIYQNYWRIINNRKTFHIINSDGKKYTLIPYIIEQK